jgi:hypothetical protein
MLGCLIGVRKQHISLLLSDLFLDNLVCAIDPAGRMAAAGHDLIVPAVEWCESKSVRSDTPLLLIARRLKCEKCGERKAHCWPEPYDGLQVRR